MKTPSHTEPLPTDTGTDFDRFKDFVKKIISVPKKEIDQQEAKYQRQKPKRKKSSKKPSLA